MKLRFTTTLLAAVAAGSGIASASTVGNLADLATGGGSLAIGDKTFSSFGYVVDGLTGFNPASIQVEATALGGDYFLTWGGNIAVESSDSVTPALGDLLLTYTVTATSGKVTSIDQSYAGEVSNGIGSVSVAETVKNAGDVIVANSFLSIGDTSDPFAEAGDNLAINPGESVLHVIKDINLAIRANSGQQGVTTISQVQQSFHQNQTVPDGGSAIALLGIALIGLEGLRRKTRSTGNL